VERSRIRLRKRHSPTATSCYYGQSDSVLVKFTRTTGSGEFRFSGILKGKYLLLVTYPAYADYVDELEVKIPSLPLSCRLSAWN
jgi:hypothetical protein